MEGGILAHIYHVIIYRNNLIIFLNTPTYLLNCCSLFTISCQWPVSFVLKQAIPPSWINLIYSVYSVGRPVTKSCSNMTFCLKFENHILQMISATYFCVKLQKNSNNNNKQTNKQTRNIQTNQKNKNKKQWKWSNLSMYWLFFHFCTILRSKVISKSLLH